MLSDGFGVEHIPEIPARKPSQQSSAAGKASLSWEWLHRYFFKSVRLRANSKKASWAP
jgi:hypothetical protein